ncbi:hypothetical protein MMC11_004428 [Xylographa trunciseda]|nr:hypothetical protein [Xylographa trunciseda]
MDPLSLTVNVVAVVTVVVQAARCIDRLKAIRNLPDEYRLLLQEVSHIHEVLSECSSLDIHDHWACTAKASLLLAHVQRAGQTLEALERTIEANVGGSSPRDEIKAFWAGLVRGKEQLARFREELRDIRLAVTTAMTAMTSSAVARIEKSVQEVAHSQSHLLQLIQLFTADSDRLDEEEEHLPPYVAFAPSASHFPTSVEKMTRKISQASGRQLETPRTSSSLVPANLQDVQASKDACVAWCSCKCHERHSLRTAQVITNLLGNLSVTFYGLPLLAKPCDQHSCRRRQTAALRVTYRFPTALVQRVLAMSMSFADLRGPEMKVKLPRMVDWTSPIWGPAIDGNTALIRDLFARGEASPWDMNPIGGSVLHYAADHFNAGTCRMLLDAGADPLLEDDCKRAPVVMAWEHALSGNLSKEDTLAVAELFQDTEYLSTRRFSVLHKIVLGLLTKDLETELQGSTSEINVPDSQGRTPLSWAAARGDSRSVQILLEHGAQANLADEQANSPLHYSKNDVCARLLLLHGADVSSRNCWGGTALHTVCRTSGDVSLLSLLLNSGGDPDARDHEKQSPLHDAALKSHTACVERLLSLEVDINIGNASGDSPLRFAIMFNAHASLRYMLTSPLHRADFSGVNSYGHTFSHSIARAADAKTIRILAENLTVSFVLDTTSRDSIGKTSAQYLEEKLSLLAVADTTDMEATCLKEAVEQLVAITQRQDQDCAHLSGSGPQDVDKLHISIRAIELDANENEEKGTLDSEVFYDAVEA